MNADNELKDATLLQRALANLIDFALLNGVFGVLAVAVVRTVNLRVLVLSGAVHTGAFRFALAGGVILFTLAYAAAVWLYFMLFESSKAAGTLGKCALKIKVVHDDGACPPAVATKRFFIKAAAVVPTVLLLDLTLYFFSEKKQMLHDTVAGTRVVSAEREKLDGVL